jgi:hypothetical protein
MVRSSLSTRSCSRHSAGGGGRTERFDARPTSRSAFSLCANGRSRSFDNRSGLPQSVAPCLSQRAASVAAAACCGLLLGGVAIAQTDADTETIQACVKNDGSIRIVDSADQCRRNETPLGWNVQWPTGLPCEPGPRGPPPKGPQRERANPNRGVVATFAVRSRGRGSPASGRGRAPRPLRASGSEDLYPPWEVGQTRANHPNPAPYSRHQTGPRRPTNGRDPSGHNVGDARLELDDEPPRT